MPDYFIPTFARDPKNCSISRSPSDLPHRHYPVDGIRLGPTAYQSVFDMAANNPGIAVPDFIKNAMGYTLVSARLKELLANTGVEIEFLPFKLRNHKGRFAAEELFIANVIGAPDGVDTAKTVGEVDPVNKGRYMFVQRVFLDPQKLDPQLALFRLRIRPQYLVMREDLKQQLEGAGITGIVFNRVGDPMKLD
ncbi:MAG TPA: DUF1629 domain-containing protein [Gammaproteobacteria bacterium]|nr:DUF1629 domain-containing protein [Gammaproteobacteria bacterium]